MSLTGIWGRLRTLIGGRAPQPDALPFEKPIFYRVVEESPEAGQAGLLLELVRENSKLLERVEVYEKSIRESGAPIGGTYDLKTALTDACWLQEAIAGRTSMAPIFAAIQTRHPEILLRVTQEVRECLAEIETQSAREPERRPMVQ